MPMNKKSYNKILIGGAVAALLLIAGAWVSYSPFLKGSTASSQEGFKSSASLPAQAGEDLSTSFSKGGISQGDIGAEEIAKIQASDFTETYKNAKYRFSFKYPEGYTVRSIPDEATGGDIVLVQDLAGKAGVQIALSPFDEPNAVLTPNRVEQEAGITVESPQDVLIGKSGKGLAFIGHGTDFGTSREVWFVFGTTLYQMSTYIEWDELLKNVLSTWQFN
ncbi:MAG: hypothetical protein Q7R93_05380 [bacterium]|nr:hypothetical protein [bacterium]